MSIYKRGDVYWYKFMWQGKLVRLRQLGAVPVVARLTVSNPRRENRSG